MIKVFDYMACKKPVLVTIGGITRELIEQAKCGYYSEPGDINSFKNLIDSFAAMDEEKLAEMGTKGYDFVLKNFDRTELAKKYITIIASIN